MNRRQILQYLSASSLGLVAAAIASRGRTQTPETLEIEYLGHTCFTFTSGDLTILVNPFRPGGCTSGFAAPRVEAEWVLVSSLLLDEGALDGLERDRVLYESGVYDLYDRGIQFQGIRTDHDRVGGRRFGINVAWRWTQAGIKILHLGGIASPLTDDQLLLTGRPDVLFVPVGGSDKAYNAREARSAIGRLRPKLVIPTHYRTAAADEETCDIDPLDTFLAVMEGTPVRRANSNMLALTESDIPNSGTIVQILSSPV